MMNYDLSSLPAGMTEADCEAIGRQAWEQIERNQRLRVNQERRKVMSLIKKQIKRFGLSINQLARISGVPKHHLKDMLSCRVDPLMEHVLAVMTVLDIELVEEEETEETDFSRAEIEAALDEYYALSEELGV